MNEKDLRLRLQRDAENLGEFSDALLERIMEEVQREPDWRRQIAPRTGTQPFSGLGRLLVARSALVAASIGLGFLIWSFMSPSAGFLHETQWVRLPSESSDVSEEYAEMPTTRELKEFVSDASPRPIGFAWRLVQALPQNMGLGQELRIQEWRQELLPEDFFTDRTGAENASTLYSESFVEEEEEGSSMEAFSSMCGDALKVVHSSFIRIFEEE